MKITMISEAIKIPPGKTGRDLFLPKKQFITF